MGRDDKFRDSQLPCFLATCMALCLACFWLLGAAVPVYRGRISSANRSNSGTPRIDLFRSHSSPNFPQRPLLIARPLFPYSIVPGGVESAQELRNAIAHDPVVAEHYADFDLPNACIRRNDRNRSVYVSYRIGEKIFWTKKPLTIAKGETLITDGAHIARTRCGNRVSETPVQPMSPAEPPPQALETAQNPGLLADPAPLFELPIEPPPVTGIEVVEHRGESFFPPILPVYWGGGSSGSGSSVNPTPATPPILTPEPGTLFMVGAGVSTALLLRTALLS
jgi:hypothetical protein